MGKRPGFAVVIAALTTALAISSAPPVSIRIDDFSRGALPSGLPEGWEPLTFAKIGRHTRYRIEGEGDQAYLTARASASASGLLKRVRVDLAETPMLAWRWRVRGPVRGADPRRKSGDDYAARVYVAFAYDPARASLWERARFGAAKRLYGEYPPQAALNYVWDNRLPAGTELDNAYTDRVKMVVVESGDRRAGEWVSETRDVLRDYRRLFGADPPPLAFVAVMTDTDNTAEEAEAGYDDLWFLPRPIKE